MGATFTWHRRILRSVRMGVGLSLMGATFLLAALTGPPAWAPEDPWRLAALAPPVRSADPETIALLAEFVGRHRVRLRPEVMFDIAESVARQSERYRVDARLLLAVIMTESSFRADAVSHKGAIGLMQLLPSTAEQLAADLDLEWSGKARLLEPHTNIALGTRYLSYLLESFDGDVHLALTAYNFGPAYVRAVLAAGPVEEADAPELPLAYANRVVGRLGGPPRGESRIVWQRTERKGT